MASWTPPTIHATGDIFSVSDNNVLANNELFLYQRPYAAYYNSVVTSMASGSFTQVTLGATTAAGYGFSVSSNNVIVPLTGVYFVSATVTFATLNANIVTAIYHNGSAVYQSRVNDTQQSGLCVSGIVSCSASDTIGLYGFQDSGGAINTLASASQTNISVFLLGSQ